MATKSCSWSASATLLLGGFGDARHNEEGQRESSRCACIPRVRLLPTERNPSSSSLLIQRLLLESSSPARLPSVRSFSASNLVGPLIIILLCRSSCARMICSANVVVFSMCTLAPPLVCERHPICSCARPVAHQRMPMDSPGFAHVTPRCALIPQFLFAHV